MKYLDIAYQLIDDLGDNIRTDARNDIALAFADKMEEQLRAERQRFASLLRTIAKFVDADDEEV